MTWDAWVTGLQRDCSARLRSARTMNESASSSWPTARAADASGSGYQRDKGKKGAERLTLSGLATIWRTPQASDHKRGAAADWSPKAKAGQHSLSRQVSVWPTPVASDAAGGLDLVRRDTGRPNSQLKTAAAVWPTPAERDWRAPNSQISQDRRNSGSARGQQLPNFVEHHFFMHLGQPIPAGTTFSSSTQPSRRRLNVLFVEWLMGWPIGWTDCASAVTAFPLWLRLMRCALCALPSADQRAGA